MYASEEYLDLVFKQDQISKVAKVLMYLNIHCFLKPLQDKLVSVAVPRTKIRDLEILKEALS